MKEETIEFYNKESSQYSEKRYEGITNSYFQFVFKRRLTIFLSFFDVLSRDAKNIKALEIGCADGIVARKLLLVSEDKLDSVVGVDISPDMISQAKQITHNPKITYYMRGEEPAALYNLIFELGVHPYDFEGELKFVSSRLVPEGYFIYSLASRGSLQVKFKLKGAAFVNDYMDYTDYEKIIVKYFNIVSSEPYGLFIPKLWAFPGFARIVQPIIEKIFKNIFPNLFHEKVYLLKKKQS